jgi:aspartate racemase
VTSASTTPAFFKPNRVIGLIGGMSWVSTAHYYEALNSAVAARLGGDHSARLVLWQTDFDTITSLQRAGRWDEAGAVLAEGAKALVGAGAEMVAICANTMHLVAPQVVAAASPVPLIHIVEAVRDECQRRGITKLGLLGTAYTMESPDLFPSILTPAGIEMLIPETQDRAEIQRHTFDELIQNRVTEEAKARFTSASKDMINRGAQAIVLACTEHAMVMSDGDVSVPVLDSTAIHVEAILAAALNVL